MDVAEHPEAFNVSLSGYSGRDPHHPQLRFDWLTLGDVEDRENQAVGVWNSGQRPLNCQRVVCRHEGLARCSAIFVPRRAPIVPLSASACLDSSAIHRPSAIQPQQFVRLFQ